MQSPTTAGNDTPIFHVRTTRCLAITQLFIGIALATFAGLEIGFANDGSGFVAGFLGIVLALCTLFISGIFGICSAMKPANLYLNCINMGVAIVCFILSLAQIILSCLLPTGSRPYCYCYDESYFPSRCDCYSDQTERNLFILQAFVTMAELAFSIAIMVFCFKNGCCRSPLQTNAPHHGNSAITEQVPYNPRYLLGGENQRGTYGSIGPNDPRSTQYQQPVQGGVLPYGSTANPIQRQEDAELLAKFQEFLSTRNQLEPATRVRDQPHSHDVNPFTNTNQYPGPGRLVNPYTYQRQQNTTNAPFQSTVNVPAQITVARPVQNVMDIPPHLPATSAILQPTVIEGALSAPPSNQTVEQEKFEEQQRQRADATHNRRPLGPDTPMPTDAPPAYQEEDTIPKTA